MKFIKTELVGACIIDIERLEDERGFFARSWCEREFRDHGLNPGLAQCSISFNRQRGTLRGMHYQIAPDAEAKIVRCTAGSIYDVIIDLRRESPTFTRWVGVELSAENRRMLYVPEGFAHGFQTLADNSEVFYQISQFYAPASARGVRWNDPQFGITWPLEITAMSDKDRLSGDFDPHSGI
jgi:dTDP-4-dehydrorhamnose 3,5-epimerase